jgi:hypothetical protein
MSNTKSAAGVQGAPEAKHTEKPELSKFTVPAKVEPKKEKPAKVLGVEEIKSRIEIYRQMLEKHTSLKESKTKIENLNAGADENKVTLELKSGYSQSFSTGNPIIIKEIIAIIRSQINSQCGKVEDEILNFII